MEDTFNDFNERDMLNTDTRLDRHAVIKFGHVIEDGFEDEQLQNVKKWVEDVCYNEKNIPLQTKSNAYNE